jgi:hypothetical protein
MPSDQKPNRIRGFWTTLPSAAQITALFVAVAATFFASRASLQTQITELRSSLRKSEPITQYLDRAKVYQQVTTLRLLEREMKRIQDFFTDYGEPVFVYVRKDSKEGERVRSEGSLFGSGWVPDEDNIVAGRKDGLPLPAVFPMYSYETLVVNEATRSIRDKDLVADLYEVFLAVDQYNSLVRDVCWKLDRGNTILRPRVSLRISQQEGEAFLKNARRQVDLLKKLVPGLADRIRTAREEVEGVLR